MYTVVNDGWDDEFVPPNPETTFLGYKCPYFQCDIIQVDHDFCLAVRKRLDTMAKLVIPESDFLQRFKWNWEQWLLKTHNNILDRAL